jgi:beta-mannosidase
MILPGDIHSTLLESGQIADPYFGRNEYDARWVAERDWILTREFDLEDANVALILSGLDTVAEIRLNEKLVLSASNSFRTHRADLSNAAVAGRNRIEIRILSSVATAQNLQASQPFYVPYHKGNCPIPNGNMLRKPQCDFGWDWNIALAPIGVYGAIVVEPKRDVRIADVSVEQVHRNGRVLLYLSARIDGEAVDKRVEFAIAGQAVQAEIRDNIARAELAISDPKFWWPAGLGEQALYELNVTLDGRTVRRRIGLRTIELVVEDDDAGTGFKFRVNSRDIFARGANWIPADALPGRITPDKTRDLLQSAVDANMNMIRIWGGGRYEPDWFYDLCDELGLLVWQDFMFACHLYPSTPEFLSEIDGEVREIVARLSHHPSIAVWCGDNELLGALNWFEESRNNRDRYLVAYDRLNRTIETALNETAPAANWWPSSPSPGYMSFGDGWHDDTSGDMHFWSVWHEGRDFEHYRDVEPRFCSEFGFQSYPSMNVVRTFAEPKDFNIAAPVLESHQKNTGGNARIAETMFRYFRFPTGFENFVYLSQVQQAMAIKTAVDYWRSLKPHCMGALYWQLNDTWPVASWSSLDYGGGWKLLHHVARRFFTPVSVVAIPDESRIEFAGINDGPSPVDIMLNVFASTPDGTARKLCEASAWLGTEAAVPIVSIDRADLEDGEILMFEWTSSDMTHGADHLALDPYKSLDLLEPQIRITADRGAGNWHLNLRAKAPAFFTAIEADVAGRFSDNCFLLHPDHPRMIEFQATDPAANPSFTVRDLHSATYGPS